MTKFCSLMASFHCYFASSACMFFSLSQMIKQFSAKHQYCHSSLNLSQVITWRLHHLSSICHQPLCDACSDPTNINNSFSVACLSINGFWCQLKGPWWALHSSSNFFILFLPLQFFLEKGQSLWHFDSLQVTKLYFLNSWYISRCSCPFPSLFFFVLLNFVNDGSTYNWLFITLFLRT